MTANEHPQDRHPDTSFGEPFGSMAITAVSPDQLQWISSQPEHAQPYASFKVEIKERPVRPDPTFSPQGGRPKKPEYIPPNNPKAAEYFQRRVSKLALSPRQLAIIPCTANALTVPEITELFRQTGQFWDKETPPSERAIAADMVRINRYLQPDQESKSVYRSISRVVGLSDNPPTTPPQQWKRRYNPEYELEQVLDASGADSDEKTVINLVVRGWSVKRIAAEGLDLNIINPILLTARGTFRVRRAGLLSHVLGFSYALPKLVAPSAETSIG